MNQLIKLNEITSRIYSIRGIKVMLDKDLAELYDVETRIIKRNVRRQIKRFPEDCVPRMRRRRTIMDTS